ncbi:MAG: cysteine--tRNA ligase [Candidatus Moranbacteria bacterium RIFCSPHIGHO2_01_FULL_55_24]|nr:MAG: cysteine--tRNA ligase [Candidatus Moranbacteria bacterium RIFCSPHIGHO2_01_FULL_55_24]
MLSFYNTLSKKKEEFIPLNPGKVGMYVCGPTVYDYAHIGNLRAYVFSDTLRRVLEDAGYEVRMIKNITDVGHLTADDIAQGDQGEDKIAKKALAEKKTPEDIATFYADYFFAAENRLNILPAHFFPTATAHIPQIIRLIEELIAKGHAYEKNGNVFYDVTSFPAYGKLSGNTLEQLKVGARLEEHPDKRNPWDFALWLKAPEGHLMRWASPWSEGYPGWHIECSAMALEYLGTTFDIHTGGEDHIFPHHEAEIAQSEGATGVPFARYFMHVRHMLVDGEKMSKSKGNFYTLEDVIERGYSPMDFRLMLLGAHYRSQMNFTWAALDQAMKNRRSFRVAKERLLGSEVVMDAEGFDGKEYVERIRTALQDDLNTPEALAIALEFAKSLNTALDTKQPLSLEGLANAWETIYNLFGLQDEAAQVEVPEEVKQLAEDRIRAREEGRYADADALRNEIGDKGFVIEDRPGGYTLHKA